MLVCGIGDLVGADLGFYEFGVWLLISWWLTCLIDLVLLLACC